MILRIYLYLLYFGILRLTRTGNTNSTLLSTTNPENIPVVSESNGTCSCAQNQNSSPCRGGIYIDYYYKPPYSGYPESSSYLPPKEAVPDIIKRLTKMRNVVKDFVKHAEKNSSNVKKALYVKNNFGKVHYILKAISAAANSTQIQEQE